MVFSSPFFLFLFLPIVLASTLLINKSYRNYILLIASIFFYTWGEGELIILLLLSILINYVAGLVISHFKNTKTEKFALFLAIFINIGGLILFKYTNFILDNVNPVIELLGFKTIVMSPIHLPVGISFFTFHCISYLIDIYRSDAEVQKDPVKVALYVSFFPQLIAGPIIRYHDIAEQIIERTIDIDKFSSGVKRFIEGLGKKVLIANTLAVIVDKIFNIPLHELPPGVAWFGVIAFALQMYFDFSGYTDMAIGLGKMFGFNFPENFNFPFISQSLTEFWRRWHISLSTWFRDYFYMPLAFSFSKKLNGKFSVNFALFITFLLIGLWHGANWNFVIFGLIQGTFLVIETLGFQKVLNKTWQPVRHIYTLFIVILGSVFFRSESFDNAVHLLGSMFGIVRPESNIYGLDIYFNNENVIIFIAGILFSTPIIVKLRNVMIKVLEKKDKKPMIVYHSYSIFSICIYLLIFVFAAMYLANNTYNPFLYFRF